MPTSTRRSARAKNIPAGDVYMEEQPSDSPDDDEELPPARKRAKTKSVTKEAGLKSAKRAKGVKGKLSKLPDMPLDVLFEIFGFLHPFDLLNLGRTTKALRQVLMARSARPVWRESFETVQDLPKCPEDMSEPQYANLVFDTTCSECLKSRGAEAFWAWRIRLCKKCLKLSVMHYSDGCGSGTETWGEIRKQMYPVRPCFLELSVAAFRAGKDLVILCRDLDRLETDAAREIALGNDLKRLREEYVKSCDDRMNHHRLCTAWGKKSVAAKENEREEARERRFTAITQRLKDLGWGEELDQHPDWYTQLEQLPAVKQPKDLTDRIWANIESSIIEFMESCKELGINKERSNRTKTRLEHLSTIFDVFKHSGHPNILLASAADICFMPQIRTLIESSSDDEFETFKASFPDRITELSRQCLEAREDAMAKLIPKPTKEPTKTDSPGELPNSAGIETVVASPRDLLKLATTWFKCTGARSYSCHDLFRSEDAHHHPCLVVDRRKELDPDTDAYVKQLGARPWNLYGGGIAYVRPKLDIFQVCGVDPEKVTAAEMDDLRPRFFVERRSSVELKTWRGMIHDSFNEYIKNDDWRLLQDHELPEYQIVGPRPKDERWSCLICWREKLSSYLRRGGERVSIPEVVKHITSSHNNPQPTSDDYYHDHRIGDSHRITKDANWR